MIYGPDCVKVLGLLAAYGINRCVVKLLRQLGIWAEEIDYGKARKGRIKLLCMINAELVYGICTLRQPGCVLWGIGLWEISLCGMCFSVIMACLLFAGIMDGESGFVYSYVWWIAAVPAVSLWLARGAGRGGGLLLYFLLQEIFFSRMYGKADCRGFEICALTLSGLGAGLQDYLIHMLLAFWMLAGHQICRKNIAPGGDLVRPVPFVPYIYGAFGLFLSVFIL